MVKEYYSNCLVEAIKAKLHNWRSVKIIYMSPRWNSQPYPHFMWTDGKNEYEFRTDKELKPWQILYFKGYITSYHLGFADVWKVLNKAKRKELRKKRKEHRR